MPIINGFDLIRQLSRIKPEIKILFMTALMLMIMTYWL